MVSDAGPGPMQHPDGLESSGGPSGETHRPGPAYLTCACAGPPGWHCPGEDSEHWAKTDDPDAECGHCGSRPSEA